MNRTIAISSIHAWLQIRNIIINYQMLYAFNHWYHVDLIELLLVSTKHLTGTIIYVWITLQRIQKENNHIASIYRYSYIVTCKVCINCKFFSLRIIIAIAIAT